MQEKCVFYPGVKFQGDIPNFVPLRGLQSAGSPVTQSSPNAKTGIEISQLFCRITRKPLILGPMFLHNTYINPAILHILHTLWTSLSHL